MESVSGVRLSLLVDNYDRAIRFYCEQTGLFSLVADVTLGPNTRYVVLGYTKTNAPFCLVVFQATNPNALALVGHQGGGLPLFVLPVDDCLTTYERLKAAGVPFTGEPMQLPYGCQAIMVDPFGNEVGLSERY